MENKILTADLQSDLLDMFKKYVSKYDSFGFEVEQRPLNCYEPIDGFIPFFQERIVFETVIMSSDFYKFREETTEKFSLDKYDNAYPDLGEDEELDLEREPYMTVMLSIKLFDLKLKSNRNEIDIDLWIETTAYYEQGFSIEPKQYFYTESIKKFDFEKVKEKVEKLLKQWF